MVDWTGAGGKVLSLVREGGLTHPCGGMPQLYSQVCRYALLLLIVYAPTAMGSIPAWAECLLVEGCYLVAALHFFDFVSRRGWTDLPWVPLVLWALILLLGWGMALNAKYVYVAPILRLLPLPAAIAGWPGSYDREASFHLMVRLTAFAAVFVMVLDLSRDPVWRRRILMTMGLTGVALTAFGLSEKSVGLMGLWPQYGHNVWPFATYYYHGNAGAFINLIFPLAVAFTARSFFFGISPWWRGLWVLGLVIAIAGAFVNVSKAAQAVFLVLVLFCFLPWLRLLRKSLFTRKMLLRGAIVVPVFFVAVGAVLYFGDLGQAIIRWTQALNQTVLVSSGRIGVAELCLRIMPQAGAWGFGPGSFASIFPYAASAGGGVAWGFWRFAHEDYLQTVLEWGYAGAFLWGMLFFGGLFSAFLLALRSRKPMRLSTRILLGGVGCSLLGCALHSLVDFPLQIASLEFYVFIFLAIGWGAWQWPREGRTRR